MGAASSENKKPKKDNEQKTNSKREERIDEGNTNNAPPISERASKKLYNSIFRISVKYKGRKMVGTGFFIKINIKKETKLFLMTCHHIIQKEFVDNKITITLYYGEFDNENEFNIKLDKN